MKFTIVNLFAVTALGLTLTACKKAEPKAEVVAPVRVSPAIKGSIRLIVNVDAVLFPRDQANIVPKISAPVKRFLVNRGDHVKQGQLLAELENRDLVAAAQESRGQFAQAESNYRSTAGAAVPEQVTKAQTDVTAARESMDAAKRLLDNRQQLFKDGALAKKLVDDKNVAHEKVVQIGVRE
ncbi:MAG: efflux transporter, family, subunit, partial [Acidobacteria bacterium]|nr:efflux transporter, family, subunit [Acidobacteriota bacterium]